MLRILTVIIANLYVIRRQTGSQWNWSRSGVEWDLQLQPAEQPGGIALKSDRKLCPKEETHPGTFHHVLAQPLIFIPDIERYVAM